MCCKLIVAGQTLNQALTQASETDACSNVGSGVLLLGEPLEALDQKGVSLSSVPTCLNGLRLLIYPVPNPARPIPNRTKVAGSGIAVDSESVTVNSSKLNPLPML